jgi:prevent-host-death family protein
MMAATWSVQDAKNRFSAVIEAARREPQVVTKHGKPAVVVINVAEYDRLRQQVQAKRLSFVDFLRTMPKDDGEFERIDVTPRDVEF